jgi:hypothetical protein
MQNAVCAKVAGHHARTAALNNADAGYHAGIYTLNTFSSKISGSSMAVSVQQLILGPGSNIAVNLL